ncbi:putative glycoside hydrolase family 3 domain protein [Phaeoacremonium minimum UCRPA7]|uniref:beta-glucosidase n=1 Tax=Phaeoacremonium minimum (strain UCR-PA7) TaxID=1286976 RepID=R8BXR3_PHAM7|nr:putative glycoside hydrolase family 3 domain protein [Phaeoacremonium minimum UCRPA7]EOO04191.1 putative glycoside hydrolase family 3 domain protein [Phaeoacremonium minimum UCRPA7]
MNNVTTFPAPVAAAASWNTTLQYTFGQALAEEHLGKGRNVVLAPTINIVRSPSWARAAESFSEDPYLTARMAVAGVKGIQSTGAVACPKHFAAYNQDTNRFGLDPGWDTVDIIADKRALHELYFPAFKASVQEAKAGSVMCSYNKLNGFFACENEWLLNKTLKSEWGFDGFVVADWYFSTRSTVAAANNGLDISMPGGSFESSYGFPAYYGELLAEAVANGSVPASRIDDMVMRLWRPMFAVGAIDEPVSGHSLANVRTREHLDLAQKMAEDGTVLLKNEKATLPISKKKYGKIAVFGVDATNESQVTENHGGFVIDSTMAVQAPFDALKARGEKEGIIVNYSEAYPGTGEFDTVDSTYFQNGSLQVQYYTTSDWSGPVNQSTTVHNITSASYPSELWVSYPQVWSATYTGKFIPRTSGVHYFSMTGQGDALFYLDNTLVANMSKANFGNTIQGTASLLAGTEYSLQLNYSMGYSLSTGAYGITLGLNQADKTRDLEADALASEADLSIIFASDRWSEGNDNNLNLELPGDQNSIISRLAKKSQRTIVVLNTNSAVLMPWIDDVDAVLEAWYGGQQIGLALERLMYGDISPSGKLPVTFPKTIENAIQIYGDILTPYEEGLNVGYRRFDSLNLEPLFPFGHGLTYTSFRLDGPLRVQHCAYNITASASLINTGTMSAYQVVQLYVSYPDVADEPPKLLRAFEKFLVAPDGVQSVVLAVKMEDLNIWNEEVDDWRFVSGAYTFMLGFSAGDIKLKKTVLL